MEVVGCRWYVAGTVDAFDVPSAGNSAVVARVVGGNKVGDVHVVVGEPAAGPQEEL